jgi:hypothetical protein
MINQSNKVLNTDITKLVNQYGFSTNIEKDVIEKDWMRTLLDYRKKKKETSFY